MAKRILWFRLGPLAPAVAAAVIALAGVARAPGAVAEPPQAQPEAAPSKPAGEKKTHDVYLEHADRMRRDERTGDVTVAGNPVVLKHEEGTFTAREITFNEKTKLGSAAGAPTFKDPETQATGDRLEFDFDKRLAVFTGHVTLVAERKKKSEKPAEESGKEDTQKIEAYAAKPTTITCDRLEYYYREKRAVAAGHVKAVQERGTAEAERATYLVDDELLVAAGNVRMRTDEDETFRCDKITISLKENWMEAEGQVASHFKVTEEEAEGGQGEP
jgi:lipopolysaccharide assembly outer membrane protein LptD (OstA)